MSDGGERNNPLNLSFFSSSSLEEGRKEGRDVYVDNDCIAWFRRDWRALTNNANRFSPPPFRRGLSDGNRGQFSLYFYRGMRLNLFFLLLVGTKKSLEIKCFDNRVENLILCI